MVKARSSGRRGTTRSPSASRVTAIFKAWLYVSAMLQVLAAGKRMHAVHRPCLLCFCSLQTFAEQMPAVADAVERGHPGALSGRARLHVHLTENELIRLHAEASVTTLFTLTVVVQSSHSTKAVWMLCVMDLGQQRALRIFMSLHRACQDWHWRSKTWPYHQDMLSLRHFRDKRRLICGGVRLTHPNHTSSADPEPATSLRHNTSLGHNTLTAPGLGHFVSPPSMLLHMHSIKGCKGVPNSHLSRKWQVLSHVQLPG